MLSTAHADEGQVQPPSLGQTFAPADAIPSSTSTSSKHGATPPSSEYLSPSEELLTSLLNVPLRVVMSDGRSFVGNFICVDRSMNLILSQAEEFLPEGWGKAPAEAAGNAMGFMAPESSKSGNLQIGDESSAQPSPSSPLAKFSHFDPSSPLPLSTPGGWGGREMSMVLCPGDQIVKVEAQLGWKRWMGIMDVEEVYT